MCGIVGLFIKNPAMEKSLGEHLSNMLVEMTERGPDSSGIAIYDGSLTDGTVRITLLSTDPDYSWEQFKNEVRAMFGASSKVEINSNHAVLILQAEARTVQGWLKQNYPELYMTSSGTNITIFKEIGLPVDVISKFGIRNMSGSHALGHTRMATESAVTTSGSHPFSTGADLCLVHNGSMSNHNRMRRNLQFHGVEFQTENDSEVAAGYLTWRLQQGDTLDEALERGFDELDGFYTFAIGTHDGFAVVKDPIGAKPAILAETDDWVAMASEFRAIATLPGVENAKIWEPEPARVYSWYKNSGARA
ncbi:MAG: glutamate synthase domain-containing protein 1 [Candidatus Azotimanducaceae bacterium]|jgi:glutamate synthase domain-containing protein 1